ncbi:MAG: ABC transporter ATP-binding protein [Candidatus Ryanbacteria bacterium]|nr:ABC transporter ATP-binding protein [Candidatus Ryanbacteria bacterium]
MIKAEKLIKSYGTGELELVVLKGLDFEIKTGEFAAIIGPSGSGKSTLLYQLSLLDEPTSGEVILGGVRTGRLSMQEKTDIRLGKLGYVFQDYALLPELTALENVALPIIMQGHTMQESYAKASLALERIGMVDKKHNLPSQLSGGQQQRVSIARAIAHEPQILFADEPTANLDSVNGMRVMEAFRDLHEKSDQTIIMVTHEPEYAAFAERVITLVDGVIVSDERKSVVK